MLKQSSTMIELAAFIERLETLLLYGSLSTFEEDYADGSGARLMYYRFEFHKEIASTITAPDLGTVIDTALGMLIALGYVERISSGSSTIPHIIKPFKYLENANTSD